MYLIVCDRCGNRIGEETPPVTCPACGGRLHFEYPGASYPANGGGRSMWKYRSLLPVREGARIVSLNEGGTPLEEARFCDGVDVYLKNETVNPTGSHKDRALSVAVTKAVEFGRDAVILFSDGSTALSAAAYAARAGLRSIVVVCRGTPEHRLLPLRIYNCRLLEHPGTGTEARQWVREASRALGIYEGSTNRLGNPYQAEGSKTLGFEIFDQLGRVPDWVVVPVGGGGTISGIWRAFCELQRRGLTSRKPRMAGVLPEGYATLVRALHREVPSDEHLRELAPPDGPPTLLVKIAAACPRDGLEAVAAVRDSGGLFLHCSDAEAVAAQQKLGSRDGIYAEPSAAASVVGVEKLVAEGKISAEETAVAVVTGSGFRETGCLSGRLNVPRIPVDATAGFATLERTLREDNL